MKADRRHNAEGQAGFRPHRRIFRFAGPRVECSGGGIVVVSFTDFSADINFE